MQRPNTPLPFFQNSNTPKAKANLFKTSKRRCGMKLAKIFLALSVGLVLSFGSQWALAQTNFWEPTNGPYGGDVQALAISSNEYIFAGTGTGKIFRSTDNGDSWTPTNLTNSSRIGSLAINPVTQDILAGTIGQGIFRSQNNGDTWTQVMIGKNVYSLAINSSGHIFAGTQAFGIFRSTDNGGSWTAVNTGLTNTTVWSLAINANDHIFAGTQDGEIFRSTDNGSNWTRVKTGVTNMAVYTLAINPATQVIFAGTFGISGGGIFRSTDNGNSWTTVGLTNTTVYELAISINGNIFAGTSSQIFHSTNNGDSWTALSTGFTEAPVNALAINGSGHVFTGFLGGVFRSTDNGDSWTEVNAGMDSEVRALASSYDGRVFVGTRGGVFYSTDNGGNWIRTSLLGNVINSLAINNQGHIFVGHGTFGGGLYRSTDNGKTWDHHIICCSIGIPVLALAINSTGHIFAGTSVRGIFRSTNNGDSWTEINTGLPNGRSVISIAINSNEHIFVAATGGVYRSTDNGDSWTTVNTGLTNTSVSALAINSNGHIFAGTSGGGVFRSTDNGDSWTTVNTGLTNTRVSSLAINSNGHVSAGTSGGVFWSINNGDSWTAVNTGLTNLNVSDLTINTSGHIFVGAVGSGVVFRSVKSTIVPAPATPTLAFPPDSAVNQPTKLTLSWDPSTDAETYHLQLSTTPNFLTTVIDDSTITMTSRQIGPLANDTKYYWRVKAKNIGGTSAWSEIRSFTTVIAAPATPTLVAPASGAENMPSTLTLSWNPSTNAEMYRLQVSTSSNFATTVVDDSTLTTTSREVGPLANKTTHYWRVNAKNVGGTSTWSNVWRFTTIVAAPSIPTLAAPADSAVNQSTTLVLSWNPATDAETYHLQVSASSDFSTTVVDDSTITATSRQVGPLTHETTYYWRVRAKNIVGTSAWSGPRRFTTIVQLPNQVFLLAPSHAAVIQADSVQLIWRRSQPAVNRYWFEIATDSAMTNPVIDSTLTAADTAKVVRQLSNKQSYWWRVRAGNVAGWGAFSQQRRFRVDFPTSVQVLEEIPTEFGLHQNHPNPFNPSTTITYALPRAVAVQLVIYDMLGRQVRALVNQRQPAGRYTITWDGRNEQGESLASGVYIYQLRAGNPSAGSGQAFVQTRRMALVR
jgi:photosystem II stability/assembly factor-like uncharacterized protein